MSRYDYDESRVPPPREDRSSSVNNNNNSRNGSINNNNDGGNVAGGYDRYDDRNYDRFDDRRSRDWDDRGGEREFKRGRYDDQYDDRNYDNRGYESNNNGNGNNNFRRDDYQQQQHYPPQNQQHQHQHQHQYYQSDAMPYDAPYPSTSTYQPSSQAYHAPNNNNNNNSHNSGREREKEREPPRSLEPPSASVVLLGLPIHVDDIMLRNFLEDMGASIDSTTVIMDRVTGLSKRYGFAKFGSVEHARSFVEPNWPAVTWRERGGNRNPLDDGLKIKINYSQKTGGWREDQGAGARLTEDKRKLIELVQAPQDFYVNDGTRDIGSSPSQILLLRGLDPLTTEDEIISSLSNVNGRAGNEIKEGSGIKKVMIAKDRASKSSWGYCFVQFSDVKLATEVLANAFNPNLYPTGFRIGNTVIAFSFCHENSFIPLYAKSEWSFKGEGGQQLAYWDDKAFVTAWIPPKFKKFLQSQAKSAIAPITEVKVIKTKEEESAEKDMEDFFSSLEAEVDVPLLKATNPKVIELTRPLTVNELGYGPGGSQLAAKALAESKLIEGDEERLRAIMKSRKGKEVEKNFIPTPTPAALPVVVAPVEKKKSGELIQTKKAAVNISKWNTKQQELSIVPSATTPIPITSNKLSSSLPSSSKPISIALSNSSTATVSSSTSGNGGNMIGISLVVEEELPFSDGKICFLCQRQFKTIEEIKRHNNLSKLHKDNLNDAKTVSEATSRKLNSIKASKPTVTTRTTTEEPKYIDRAAARRETFNQPDVPIREGYKKSTLLPLEKSFPELSAVGMKKEEVVQPNKNGIEESNVGSKMLEKMGWSKGAGLGASATGIVNPVEATSFAQGAGIGSSQGVAAGLSYSESLKERARLRLAED